MNKGERDEYIFKIYLVKLRDEKNHYLENLLQVLDF